MRTWNEILSAAAGTVVLNDTSEYTGNIAAVHVIGDAVFNILDGANGNDVDSYITDSSLSVKAGAMITPFDKQKAFTRIELLSGSVLLVL